MDLNRTGRRTAAAMAAIALVAIAAAAWSFVKLWAMGF